MYIYFFSAVFTASQAAEITGSHNFYHIEKVQYRTGCYNMTEKYKSEKPSNLGHQLNCSQYKRV
jgi:hypothetical protein